jgi:uncharacterized protein YjbI with pentapeptide repeats
MVARTRRTFTGVENLVANASHLSLLNKGVKAWNERRLKHEPDRADLSYADLRGAELSKANLSGTNLSYADLSGANLSGANLTYADYHDCDC